MTDRRPILLSGIQPSGHLALGNYLGAMRNWVLLQEDYQGIFIVVDMHAITVRQTPAELRKRCLSFAAQYIAAGIDPEQNIIFIQSHVPQHAELAWVLNCFTYMGELNRMTQFKDKSRRHEDNVNAGLFTYPALMAADILLYQTDLVPVGEDQKQHLELTRDLANRFNNAYSPTFKVPEPYIPKAGARIMSLAEPGKKMSKSDSNEGNYLALLDPPDVLRRKIRRAVTDSQPTIDDKALERAGTANLIHMAAALAGQVPEDLHQELVGCPYSVLKDRVADEVISILEPFQDRYRRILSDKGYLEGILADGARQAYGMARRTMNKVYRKIGFVAPAHP